MHHCTTPTLCRLNPGLDGDKLTALSHIDMPVYQQLILRCTDAARYMYMNLNCLPYHRGNLICSIFVWKPQTAIKLLKLISANEFRFLIASILLGQIGKISAFYFIWNFYILAQSFKQNSIQFR